MGTKFLAPSATPLTFSKLSNNYGYDNYVVISPVVIVCLLH